MFQRKEIENENRWKLNSYNAENVANSMNLIPCRLCHKIRFQHACRNVIHCVWDAKVASMESHALFTKTRLEKYLDDSIQIIISWNSKMSLESFKGSD